MSFCMKCVRNNTGSYTYNRNYEQLLTRCCRCDQSRTSGQAWIWWCSQVGKHLFFSLYVYMLHEPISCSNPLVLWNYIVVQPLSLYYHSLPCPPTERNASTFNVHCLTKSIAWSLVDLLTSYPPCFLEQLSSKPNWICFFERARNCASNGFINLSEGVKECIACKQIL